MFSLNGDEYYAVTNYLSPSQLKLKRFFCADVLYRIMSLQMLSKRSLSVIAFVSCVHLIYGQLSDFSAPYTADVAQLDFVYHNHEEMTNYLR